MCVIIHIFSHCSNRPFQCVFRWSVSNYRLCFNRSVFFNTVAPMIASFQCHDGTRICFYIIGPRPQFSYTIGGCVNVLRHYKKMCSSNIINECCQNHIPPVVLITSQTHLPSKLAVFAS